MDEKRLLEIVKAGCPRCKDKNNLLVISYEMFSQGVGYLKAYDEVCWGEPYYDGDLSDIKDAVVHCNRCGWEEQLDKEDTNGTED